MHFNKFALTAAGLALFTVARADDIELDDDDIPRQCWDICNPVYELADRCEADDDRIDNDRIEDLLEAQCFCLNDSFDVGSVTPQCAACMHEHNRDRDDNDDINTIMSVCGFSSTSYDSAAQATGVTVSADRPTDAADLTTTITDGSRATDSAGDGTASGTGSSPTETGGSDSQGGSSDSSNDGDDDNADSAAAGLSSAFGVGAYLAAAGVIGGAMLVL